MVQVSFRQGWREDVAGKHLTADLRSKRSIARLPRHGVLLYLSTHVPAGGNVLSVCTAFYSGIC